MNNFIGRDGFNWWTGMVVDRNDPLKLGRFRVRIFGVHTDNKEEVPTEDLPWATPSLSPSGSKLFSLPDEGDFAYGFFEDGRSQQAPVAMGIYPGIMTRSFDLANGFSPTGTQDVSRPPGEPTVTTVGTPSSSALARGNIFETQIAKSNSNLSHACDVNFFLEIDLGLGGLVNPVTAIKNAIKNGKQNAAMIIRMLITKFNEILRQVLDSVIEALGLDKTGVLSFTWSEAKAIIRKINRIVKKIAEYVEVAAAIVELGKQINQLIAYFNSLPARILALVQECLLKFKSAFDNILAQVKTVATQTTGSLSSILNSFSNDAQSSLDTLTGKSSTGNTTIDIANSLTNPSLDSANSIHLFIQGTYATANQTMEFMNSTAYDPKLFSQP